MANLTNMLMVKEFKLLVKIFLLFIVVSKSQNLEKYFELVKKVQLDNKVIISQISKLSVNTEGDFLITDIRSNSVHIFYPTGKHKRKLSIEKNIPGIKFSPRSAYYLNDKIVVMDSRNTVFEFDKKGRFLSDIKNSLFVINPNFTVFNNLFVFYFRNGISLRNTISAFYFLILKD